MNDVPKVSIRARMRNGFIELMDHWKVNKAHPMKTLGN